MGCVEIGLKDKGQFSTKEFNELNYKCPLMLSEMLEELSAAYPSAAKQDLCTVGFIISGFACTALSVNPSPDSALLLIKSDRFCFCEAINEFKRIVPLLHLSYNARCILEKNVAAVARSYQAPLQYTLKTKRLKE